MSTFSVYTNIMLSMYTLLSSIKRYNRHKWKVMLVFVWDMQKYVKSNHTILLKFLQKCKLHKNYSLKLLLAE